MAGEQRPSLRGIRKEVNYPSRSAKFIRAGDQAPDLSKIVSRR
jgi:hypothetical protein